MSKHKPFPVNILDILETEARRTCDRCAQGDSATPTNDGSGDYCHGRDDDRPPEPCPASPLWRVMELLHIQYARELKIAAPSADAGGSGVGK